MGRCVYLFELDSVRRTDEEVAIAQNALYDEIVNNGNRVILSYNQLTDSRFIASMLQGNQKTGNRSIQQLLELFNRGWLAFSRYGETRTPSQYLQDSIRKNLAPRDAKFVYSGIPLKSSERRLMRLTLDALQNADASVFTEFIESGKSQTASARQRAHDEADLLALFAEYERRESGFNEVPADISVEEARERLVLLKTYVQFILALSLDETTANPVAKHDPKTAQDYGLPRLIDAVVSIEAPEGLGGLWEAAIRILKPDGRLRESTRRSLDRSDWLEEIKVQAAAERAAFSDDVTVSDKASADERPGYDERPFCLAALIVNLCYNYSVEYSIFGASKHYDATAFADGDRESFYRDFSNRVTKDWKSGIGDVTRFLHDEDLSVGSFEIDVDRWERGLRILRRRKTPPTTFLKVDRKATVYTQLRSMNDEEGVVEVAAGDSVRMYEDEWGQQRKTQVRDNNFRLRVSLAITAATLVLVFLLNLLEGVVEDLSNFDVIVTSFVLFIGFAIIDRIVDIVVPESDILANFTNIFRGVADMVRNREHEVKSYFNESNKGKAKELLPKIADPLYARTPQMKRYSALRKARKDLFESEKPEEIEVLGIDADDVIESRAAAEYARDYETRTGVSLGVCYESPYHLMVVDLVRWKNTGTIGSYERLVPVVPSAGVVIAPKYQGKWVLMRQFRHALRRHQLCFPRGFGELGSDGLPLPDEQNARKELREELGASVVETPTIIGNVAPDSGILAKTAKVCYAELQTLDETSREEGICDVVLMDDREIAAAIKNKDIDDGYTLAALALAGVV